MGAHSFSIDRTLVECLLDALPLDVFVETGTFEGDTVAVVSGLFAEVHSVERSPHLAQAARRRFAAEPSVHIHEGDAAECLGAIRPRLEERSVLYWLDAHWCAADRTAGQRSQCRLTHELEAIGSLNAGSVVLIDDARLFLAPPPDPHEAADWPGFHEVLGALMALGAEHRLSVVNDVIVLVPAGAAEAVDDWARAHGFDLLAALHRLDALEAERDIFAKAAEERLAAINELSAALDEFRQAPAR